MNEKIYSKNANETVDEFKARVEQESEKYVVMTLAYSNNGTKATLYYMGVR